MIYYSLSLLSYHLGHLILNLYKTFNALYFYKFIIQSIKKGSKYLYRNLSPAHKNLSPHQNITIFSRFLQYYFQNSLNIY